MVVLLIIAFMFIVLIEYSIIKKSNQRIKTMMLSFCLIAIGFTISLLLVLDKAPASPAILIERIVQFIL